MNTLTLDQWMNKFTCNNKKTITYENFIEKGMVLKVNDEKVHIKNYITNQTDDKLKKLFQCTIEKKNEYLNNWYMNNLQVKDNFVYMNNRISQRNYNNRTNGRYKNLVRNLYFKEILQCNTVQKNIPSFLNVLKNMYKDGVFDYKLFTPSVLK